MVRFDEEESSGAPVSVRERNGQSATSAAERIVHLGNTVS
jgi:hypothetical protein